MLALSSLLEILYRHSNLKDFPGERSGQEAELWTGGLYYIVCGKIRMYYKTLNQSLHNWHRFWIMDLVSVAKMGRDEQGFGPTFFVFKQTCSYRRLYTCRRLPESNYYRRSQSRSCPYSEAGEMLPVDLLVKATVLPKLPFELLALEV